MPDITDKFGRASIATNYAVATTVKTLRNPGEAVLATFDLSRFDPTTPAYFITYKKTTDPVTGVVSVTNQTSWKAIVNPDNNTFTNLTLAPGYTDVGNAVGDFVELMPTAFWANSLIDGILENVTPSGVISPFAGASAPAHWLLCDGASLVRTDYPKLFAAIGTTFGAADTTHFNVPDMRGRSIVGVGSNTWKLTFASTDVNTSTDQIAVAANQELITGRKVSLTTTGTLPTGLAVATDYYIIVVDNTHIKLASSVAAALAGTAIDITGAGSGTHTATHTGTVRALADHGGSEGHSHSLSDSAQAQIQMAASSGTNTLVMRRISSAAWTPTHGNSSTMSFSGTSGSQVVATGLQGNTDTQTDMPPFLALNYIIKT